MTLIDTAKIGKKGGKARAAAMSAEERTASAKEAATARWDAYYKAHPEKLREKKAREIARKKKTVKG